MENTEKAPELGKESVEGRKLHARAEHEREHGSLTESLKATDEAMTTYQKDGDILGFTEVLASRVITLRHLHRQTRDKSYLLLAEKTAEAALEIAMQGPVESRAIPFYNLAEVQEEMGDIVGAVENYRAAVDLVTTNPPERHKHPAVAANFKLHLATAEYKMGDKTASGRAGKALRELEEAKFPDRYASDVWISGGHMKIAEIIMNDDPGKASRHLQFAKAIIDSNPQLVLRKAQWGELIKKFEPQS